MLKNWKDKILSFAAGAVIACTGFAVAGVVNNNEENMGNGTSIIQNWLSDGDELGWVSTGVVSAKAEEVEGTETSPSVEILANNLSYGDQMYIMYAVHKENPDVSVKMLYFRGEQTEYTYKKYQEIVASGKEDAAIGDSFKVDDIKKDGVTYENCDLFKFGLAPKRATEYVYARPFIEVQDENGEMDPVYGEVQRYSVLEYVNNRKQQSIDEATENLLDALIAYSAAAQVKFDYKKDRLATDTYHTVTIEGGLLPDGFNSGLFTAKEKIDIQAPEENEEGLPFLYWKDGVGNHYYEDEKLISLSGITQDIVLTPVYLTEGWTFVNKVSSYYITKYEGNDIDIIIPAKYKGLPVTLIAMNAFSGCTTVKSIEIPSSVESIGSLAFDGCTSLEKITLSEGLKLIGKDAFNGCRRLKTIHIPSTVTSISDSFAPFYGCAALEEITVAAGNTKYSSIEGNLYNADGTVLLRYAIAKVATELRIPNGVETIAVSAIRNATKLQKIYIPATVTWVEGYAIKNCSKGAEIYFAGDSSIVDSWHKNWNLDKYAVKNWE